MTEDGKEEKESPHSSYFSHNCLRSFASMFSMIFTALCKQRTGVVDARVAGRGRRRHKVAGYSAKVSAFGQNVKIYADT